MKTLLSITVLSLLVLTGCTTQKTEEPAEVTYDQNSWKEIIPKNCKSFFDGCNKCVQSEEKDMAACTKMFCEKYEEPKCLDEPSPYIGLSVTEAANKAKESDTPFRVVEIDGAPQAVTMDYRPGRINASIQDGKVIEVSIE